MLGQIEKYELKLEKTIMDEGNNPIKRYEPITIAATNYIPPIVTTYPTLVDEDEIVTNLCNKLVQKISEDEFELKERKAVYYDYE